MPLLDVSDVLTDPDFVTTFDVFRSTQAISSGGIAADSPEPVNASVIGVVEAASTFELQRLPEAQRQKGAIYIYTQYRLSDGPRL